MDFDDFEILESAIPQAIPQMVDFTIELPLASKSDQPLSSPLLRLSSRWCFQLSTQSRLSDRSHLCSNLGLQHLVSGR
jgi:hypothetical protein